MLFDQLIGAACCRKVVAARVANVIAGLGHNYRRAVERGVPLASGAPYREVGADYDDRRHRSRAMRRAVQTLERQSYPVTLDPAA